VPPAGRDAVAESVILGGGITGEVNHALKQNEQSVILGGGITGEVNHTLKQNE
jgi:hypothetical protein